MRQLRVLVLAACRGGQLPPIVHVEGHKAVLGWHAKPEELALVVFDFETGQIPGMAVRAENGLHFQGVEDDVDSRWELYQQMAAMHYDGNNESE